jgi:hypothetical protein
MSTNVDLCPTIRIESPHSSGEDIHARALGHRIVSAHAAASLDACAADRANCLADKVDDALSDLECQIIWQRDTPASLIWLPVGDQRKGIAA